MTTKPAFIELSDLASMRHGNPALWTLGRFAGLVSGKFPYKTYRFPEEPAQGHDFLLAVGGGTLMDHAKVWRHGNGPATRLAVIPSLWGSGAERSRVAVLNGKGEKIIKVGDEYLPDLYSLWPELTKALPGSLVRYACGDTWSHALEGFLSPLADEGLSGELADLIRRLTAQPIANDPEWFELSAQACAGQARSTVGLIHGIAHSLEPVLPGGTGTYGHARLCAAFAWPVFRLNRVLSAKLGEKFGKYGLDPEGVEGKLKELFSPADFEALLPALRENWNAVLRHPFTRTNCALVRSGDMERLKECGTP